MDADIVPFKSRRYEAVPIANIKVINSRNRDQEQFEMNVGSIKQNGMLKPVRVNDKFFSRSGMYELICGEGRLTAHQRLGHESIVAEVVTCDRKEAYLQSLIENELFITDGLTDKNMINYLFTIRDKVSENVG